MPRSSESVAALASALAKAQAELVNPEKSLTAVIRAQRPGEGERSFRYAPLASGLDIVRKTLGQHEIATVQTTAIDPTTRMVNLTTMLAHSSGEWIASDWPVCPMSETASPQRMGAALTYARRYALFTLVGIAGEDDLDAPDLNVRPQNSGDGPAKSASIGNDFSPGPHWKTSSRGNGRARVSTTGCDRLILPAAESAGLRDRLMEEISTLSSEEALTAWARKALVEKNKLVPADAISVETAFSRRLTELQAGEGSGVPATAIATASDSDRPIPHVPKGIDKSVLALPEPRRHRSKEHLRLVAKQSCLVCGRQPCDPHHLRFMQPRALGRKVSDEFVVPLCRMHHRELHREGDERKWWEAKSIDPTLVAHKLWNETRGMEDSGSAPTEQREKRKNTKSPVGLSENGSATENAL